MENCIYKTLKDNKDAQVAVGDWNTMYFRKENDEYYIRALGDGYVTLRINYCPLCGIKL